MGGGTRGARLVTHVGRSLLVRGGLIAALLTGLLPPPAPWGPGGSAPGGSGPGREVSVGLVVSHVLGVRDLGGSSAQGAATQGAAPQLLGDRQRTALWDWPLVGTPPVVTLFDPPAKRWLPGHRGIDLAGVEGEQVLAVDAGVVTFSGMVAGVGVVSVTHESGLRSTYQPVEGRLPRGERVAPGQALGTLDTAGSHCLLRTCLHLGAVRGRDDYVDPLPLLLGVELTLLPVAP